MKKITALFSLVLLVSGCVLLPSGTITTSQMGSTMEFRGFSVKRPEDPRWFVNLYEQDSCRTMFRFKTTSPTHTFYAYAINGKMETAPATKEEFKAYIDKENTILNQRHELLSYESKLVEKQGQWAVEYRTKVLDKAAANSNAPLVMKLTGYTILHPDWERTIIDVVYSERGTREEVNGTLDPIGQAWVDGVVIQHLDKTPIK